MPDTPVTTSRPKPVAIAAAVSAAIPTVVGLLVALGVIDVTPQGAASVDTAGQQIVAAVLTLASLLITIAATLRAHQVVTPLADPRDNAGRPLVVAA